MNELEGIHNTHNACCYRDKCRQQQAEIEALKETLQGRDRYIDLLMEAQEK